MAGILSHDRSGTPAHAAAEEIRAGPSCSKYGRCCKPFPPTLTGASTTDSEWAHARPHPDDGRQLASGGQRGLRFRNQGSRSDWISCRKGAIGLERLPSDKFDPAMGYKFSTYAYCVASARA